MHDRLIGTLVLMGVFAGLAVGPALANRLVSPETGFDVIAYDVSIEPDIGNASVRGVETIRLRVQADGLVRLAFSPNALSISNATLDGSPIVVESTVQALTFMPAAPLRKGQAILLSFAFKGVPRRGLERLSHGLYTSYFACDWMVCLQDSPGDKAMLSLAITVPTALTTLAPGRQVEVRAAGPGRTIHRWRTERAESPYLFAFAVGTFTRVAIGKDLVYLDGTGAGADLRTLFVDTPALVAFLASKSGVHLPVKPYTQLLVPGREAQEAAGFSLIGADTLHQDQAEPEAQWLLVHELSHQWWGNLVTCASWRDYWLNEGMATFMTAAWKEHRFGRAAYDAELAVARQRLDVASAKGFDKPLTWDGDYPSLGTRRAIHYSKGALFLDQLRRAMGDDAFWAGIRQYTRAHAGGTVTSVDFQRSMQQASTQDLAPLFAQWVQGETTQDPTGARN